MDGKVVRKLREGHKRILSERYGGVDCPRLDNQSERTRIRVYLAYMWQIWRSDQKLSRLCMAVASAALYHGARLSS